MTKEPALTSLNSFNSRKTLKAGTKTYTYFSLKAAEKAGLKDISHLPVTLKILLENLLRHEDGRSVSKGDIAAIAGWLEKKSSTQEIAFRPARVLLQDFTGVPAVVDLAAMRDAIVKLGGKADRINPLAPVDLVIDHSVMIDYFGSKDAFKKNVVREYERNGERYAFLRWGQQAFDNFRVVPPGTGICHQVNLEYLSQTVWTQKSGKGKTKVELAYPDTLVGTDSHTVMVNGLAVLGWGVGGIEAEAAMLGQPLSMLIPEVVGFKFTGALREGVTATDLVLTVTQMLRKHGVVNKFVEFFGPGIDALALEDRATIANMAPEYGATCGFFPVDAETIRFLRATGRAKARIDLVEKYAREQGMFRTAKSPDPVFTDILTLDLSKVEPCLAGPTRPQDRVLLDGAGQAFRTALGKEFGKTGKEDQVAAVAGRNYALEHGAVVIAAITSCTNTSNPSVMIGAGLLARNALKRGLQVQPWVKTSLAPGSQVVQQYLADSGLQKDLDKLGFNLAAIGCTTCIGNSGPLPDHIAHAITESDLVAAAVLSGNRNFEGRINPLTRANYLASPPLVVAYAIAGNMKVDLVKDPLGHDRKGKPVYLKDIWPSAHDIAAVARKSVTAKLFKERYADVFQGDRAWRAIKVKPSKTYAWDAGSTYIQNPPHFTGMERNPSAVEDIRAAHILGLLGDSITTDHISPAGDIKKGGPAGAFLIAKGVEPADFNSYGARRGNHDVMMRGTFANIRIKNHMIPGVEGGVTKHFPSGEQLSIYDAAMRYQSEAKPLVIFAGKEYGTGSSRDWAAKGTRLLGVRAVIAESFERIHRSNLVGMGVLPLTFLEGGSWKGLSLRGDETVDIVGLSALKPRQELSVKITYADGRKVDVAVRSRIDTLDEEAYFRHGGILHYVLRNLAEAA
jgi:aconitate hydratase